MENPLPYVSLIGVLGLAGMGTWLLARERAEADFETRKLRFAAATFTGILMLIIYMGTLCFAEGEQATKAQGMFEKTLGALAPLGGTIIGYFFGLTQREPPRRDAQAPRVEHT